MRSYTIADQVRIATVIFYVTTSVCAGSEISPREMQVWNQLYGILSPNESPRWPKGGPREWARLEQERLERIIAEILREERDEIPWNRVLRIVAPLIPTQVIRDAVSLRIESLFGQKLSEKAPLDEREHALLAAMVSVLAAGADERAAGSLNHVVLRDDYARDVAIEYLRAIQRVGNAASVEALRAMPLRDNNKEIDRMAALAERIITARLDGVTISPNAQDELHSLARVWAGAATEGEYDKYVMCFPFEVAKQLDQEQMQEQLAHPRMDESLLAVRHALDEEQPFDVDIANLRATLTCGDVCVLECIFEVDGWKILNLRPVREPEKAGK